MDDVCRNTGLSENQVYKWGWDQKKKRGKTDDAFYPTTDEFGGYSKHGFQSNLDSIVEAIGLDLNAKLKQLLPELQTPPSMKAKAKPVKTVPKPEPEIDMAELDEILRTPRKTKRAKVEPSTAAVQKSSSPNLTDSLNTERLRCPEPEIKVDSPIEAKPKLREAASEKPAKLEPMIDGFEDFERRFNDFNSCPMSPNFSYMDLEKKESMFEEDKEPSQIGDFEAFHEARRAEELYQPFL